MKDLHKEQVIKIAIKEYKTAKVRGDKREINHAINMLGNVYIMCAPFNIDGIEEVRQLILSER